MKLTYRSQHDPDASKYHLDCGTSITAEMILALAGIFVRIDDLSAQTQLGTGGGGTNFGELITLLKKYNIVAHIAKFDTEAKLAAAMKNDGVFIALISMGALPDSVKQDLNFRGGHYLLVHAVANGIVTYDDPDWWIPRRDEGANRTLDYATFAYAQRMAESPYEGVYIPGVIPLDDTDKFFDAISKENPFSTKAILFDGINYNVDVGKLQKKMGIVPGDKAITKSAVNVRVDAGVGNKVLTTLAGNTPLSVGKETKTTTDPVNGILIWQQVWSCDKYPVAVSGWIAIKFVSFL